MSDQPKLAGIFTPNIVPLDANGDINEGETRRYVDWLIDHGVHGLYPNGSTGEFTRFTAEERIRIIEISNNGKDKRFKNKKNFNFIIVFFIYKSCILSQTHMATIL